MPGDTIAAISTPRGIGGVGVIRLSGSRAVAVAASCFRPSRPSTAVADLDHAVAHGRVVAPDGTTVDECLCLAMLAPRSYTREDVVELQCHGGAGAVKAVLRTVLAAGARLAEPGEFTRRAFVNGRIDLAQAEAVGEVLKARTVRAAALAVDQLDGRIGTEVRAARTRFLRLLAAVEASVDFPDEVGELSAESLHEALRLEGGILGRLVAQADVGRLYRDGATVVLLGRPNVGKSSLLNCLTGLDRAIVTDVPGTTRDLIEEGLSIEGMPVKLVDTAGIRESGDLVETIGMKKALSMGGIADLILLVVDGSVGLQDADFAAARAVGEAPVVLVASKSDLPTVARLDDLAGMLPGSRSLVAVSARDGSGVDSLKTAVYRALVDAVAHWGAEEDPILTSLRQQLALEAALASVEAAVAGLTAGMPQDMVCVDLRGVVDELSKITGQSVTEEVIDMIFADFCVGK